MAGDISLTKKMVCVLLESVEVRRIICGVKWRVYIGGMKEGENDIGVA